jgi:hypothetical protein
VPTHRDYPWERDARAEAQRGSAPPSRATRSRAPTASPAVPGALGSGGLHRKVGGIEIVATLVICAAFLFLKVRHDGGAPSASPAARIGAAPPTVALPSPVTPSVHALHSRFVGDRRLELWGSAQAADGMTVRISIEKEGAADRPLTTAPVSAGHFYATARVPKRLGTTHFTVVATLIG